ncbi:MAG: hypothetical protein ABIO02_04670 [Patescibacteria group bacterium]
MSSPEQPEQELPQEEIESNNSKLSAILGKLSTASSLTREGLTSAAKKVGETAKSATEKTVDFFQTKGESVVGTTEKSVDLLQLALEGRKVPTAVYSLFSEYIQRREFDEISAPLTREQRIKGLLNEQNFRTFLMWYRYWLDTGQVPQNRVRQLQSLPEVSLKEEMDSAVAQLGASITSQTAERSLQLPAQMVTVLSVKYVAEKLHETSNKVLVLRALRHMGHFGSLLLEGAVTVAVKLMGNKEREGELKLARESLARYISGKTQGGQQEELGRIATLREEIKAIASATDAAIGTVRTKK